MYGIFYAYARHFRSAGERFVMLYDEAIPHRDKGGEKTVIHILLGPEKPPVVGSKHSG